MKKKVFSRRLPALALAMIMLFSLVLTACKPKDDTTETTGSTEPTGSTGQTGPKDGEVTYNIIVEGEGGMCQPGIVVTLHDSNGQKLVSGVTDEKGVFITYQKPGEYEVVVEGLREGYTATATKTTEAGGDVVVVCKTEVIEGKHPSAYAVGDVMRNFTFVDNDGNERTLKDVLAESKLVVINIWGDWCGNCKTEFPVIEKAYQQYSDQVEVLALDAWDSYSFVQEFRDEQGYSFTMSTDASNIYGSLTPTFGAVAPITMMVDRYGVVNEMESGAITSIDMWLEAFEDYTSDDYRQTGSAESNKKDEEDELLPDVEMPASSEIEAVINSGVNATYSASAIETVWPWVLTEDKTAIQPANIGKNSTSALINMTMDLEEGQILAFDYKYSIEYDIYGTDIYDFFSVSVGGDTLHTLVVPKDGWVTCYAYVPVKSGTYTVTLYYSKDDSDSKTFMDESEYLYVKNVRTMTEAQMTAENGSADIWRPAVDGVAAEGSATFFENYVDVVLNKNDGYYHVGTEDGPLLLTTLFGSTRWSGTSLDTLANNGYLNIDGIDYSVLESNDEYRSYWWLELYSDLGYSPVDAKLAYYLKKIAQNVGDSTYENGWLEMCSYYEHYGVGRGITKVSDVRSRIDMLSAEEVTLGKNHAFINQVLVPRGHYYSFIPAESGVYKFYALREGNSSSAGLYADTVAWLYDAEGNVIYSSYGDEQRNGQFVVYGRLEAGKTYYIGVGFDPVDMLGNFDFMIEYLGTDLLDIKTVCTESWTYDEKSGETLIKRRNNIYAALGEDGYYHQITGYEKDGTPILDTSETGYIYMDLFDFTEGASYIDWIGSYCNLYKYISEGYWTLDTDGKTAILIPNAFDFANRTDAAGAELKDLGNRQVKMESLLQQVVKGECSITFNTDGTINFKDYAGNEVKNITPDKNANDAEYQYSFQINGLTVSYSRNETDYTVVGAISNGETFSLSQIRNESTEDETVTYTGACMDPNAHIKVDAETAEVLQALIDVYGLSAGVKDGWMMFCYYMYHV